MFVIDSDGDYRPIAGQNPRLVEKLPAGVYELHTAQTGAYFKPMQYSAESFVSLDTPAARQVRREIADFFNPAITARLAAAGLKHRRGIILHGPPGTGKTSLVRAMLPMVVDAGAIVLSEVNADMLENTIIPVLRKDDPDRPIVLVWDEFDKNAQYSHSELLRLLDGLNSPDHLLTIGVTNDLGQIPSPLRLRPSRFGLILEMPPLGQAAREAYARNKYTMLESDMIAGIVDLTANKPLDYVEEACKLALMGYELDEIRDRVCGIPGLILAGAPTEDDDDEDDDEVGF